MRIRKMRASDLDFAATCTANEGWISETRDWLNYFYSHDPNGCFVARLNEKNVGICIATKYQKNGFIGELIVISEMRGKGYGQRLMEHSIKYLRKNCIENIYLDAVQEAVPLYERIGFREICLSLRFVGTISGQPSPYVRTATKNDLRQIFPIDTALFQDDRCFFLKEIARQYSHLCKVYLENGEVKGYIFARPGRNIVVIGPWGVEQYENENIPKALLESIAMDAPSLMRIGVLENNENAVKLLRSYKTLKEIKPSVRMVLGESESLGNNPSLFAIGSPATG